MKNKLCLALGMQLEAPLITQLDLVKNAGFDAFAYDRERGKGSAEVEKLADKAAKLGLNLEYIHAPFYGMDDIWHGDDELAQIMIKDIYATVDACRDFGVKNAVVHAIIGMDNCTPTELGLDRLQRVIEYAVKKDVNLAFENTEGEMYLEAIFKRYGDVENVKFCYDSGHEMCYNFGRDMLSKYGNRLAVTHLNDNLGMTGDEITFYDDSHLLPFDGVADWETVAKRLRLCGYDGTLSFEVIAKGRPGRSENAIYHSLTDEDYINKAYEKAVKFRELFVSAR